MDLNQQRQYRIGYWWSEKKSQKLNQTQLEKHLNERGADLIKIDLDSDLEAQGTFDAIIHKVSDLMCKVDTDHDAKIKVDNFEAYVLNHPDMVVIDTPENIRKVLDRSRQYKIIADSELADGDSVFTPTFVELTSTNVEENLLKLKNSNVTFPLVCKPIVAHGTKFAHKMSLIFNSNGLTSITPPCVAQSFVNHNARLFKLFIVKSEYFVIERPSLKNFKQSDTYPDDVIHFVSHEISKPNSSNFLTELDENDRQCEILQPEKSKLDQIVKVITKELNLSLLGIDVIIENGTGRYAIIDMNSFPGYDGVENFLQLYTNIVLEEIDELRRKFQTKKLSNNSMKQSDKQIVYDKNSVAKFSTVITSSFQMGTSTTTTSTSSLSLSSSSASKTTPIKVPKLPSSNYSESGIDSGIDTSDSCDEKKNHANDALGKFYRKQHSRSINNTLGSQNNTQESHL